MRNRHCKIVATVGPASSSPPMLQMLHEAGVDVFRLNFSHGDHEKIGEVVDAIRKIEKKTGVPVSVLGDLQGPKIRVGALDGGAIDLRFGGEYQLVLGAHSNQANSIPIPHPEILQVLEIGDRLKLDDGKLQMTVTSRIGDTIIARADTPGILSNRKGINLPDRQLPISALTEKDRIDLEYGLEIGVDYFALSFVQRAADIEEAKEHIKGRADMIAKIEKPSAVSRIDEIIAVTDGVMVARGDLGVELPPEEVPNIQRQIIRRCRAVGKPVIVATHMLESMVEQNAPTRAEASDVSTAVFQGADAVMLSAETAVGRHPPTAVAIMDRIIKATEEDDSCAALGSAPDPNANYNTADAISLSATRIAEVLDCSLAVAYTKSGSTARRLSRDRPRCAILAVTPSCDVARRLSLHWGVTPFITDDISHFHDMSAKAEALAQKHGAQDGDRIIILAGYPFGRVGKTNTIKIGRIIGNTP